ncbi:hypothetical protein BD410DRAFT_895867 [Rickenella mellea]|uniref:Uncharacterized protein n=1 Tax=Rickenella mellea TaxID=50990 RepID=A0A4Y7QE59_9AGAM|nr:hypothetical protein BD410DRAFT_895867 [Rickenella mellea]
MNSNTNTSPQLTPTLRKKKRQTFEKTSIHSISPLSSPSKSPTRKADQRTRHVEPIPRPRVSSGVRLGHPKRPYYSAIRKSKTTQALADPQPPRARPLHMSHPISVLKCPASNADDLHGSPRFVPASMGMEGAGFSLSGEIELRMQLAQRQTASNDFKFVRKARGRGISVTLRRPFAWAGRELRAVMSRNK